MSNGQRRAKKKLRPGAPHVAAAAALAALAVSGGTLATVASQDTTATVTTATLLAREAAADRPCKHYHYVVGPDGHRHRQPCSTTTSTTTTSVPVPISGPQPGCMVAGAGCAAVPASGACHFRPGPLPDPACTPGATNPQVTPATASATICVSGYTKQVRPPVSYTNPLKLKLMQAYGLTGPASDYELDHLVPLTGGGAAADPANLWPQPYNPQPGAHQKDDEEIFLNSVACGAAHGGSGPGHPERLPDLQGAIAADWLTAYQADNPTHRNFHAP